jgi:hypothetical protein
MQRQIRNRFLALLTALALLSLPPASARADEVTDWTEIMLKSFQTAGTAPQVYAHHAALVSSSIFDAVNGVKAPYARILVAPAAPKKTSARAAAVEAAYTMLMHLFPAQATALGNARTASLNAILDVEGGENHKQNVAGSVADGIAWGQYVAEAIWTIRHADGSWIPAPPFTGGTATGQWRPIPPAAAGATPELATTQGWFLALPSQFRPGPPPSLTSQQYTADYNETKSIGASNSLRTPEQTLVAQFWQGAAASYFWNHVALEFLAQRDMNLVDHARLFAALNIAIADAIVAVWDAKYYYAANGAGWRPTTAIQLGDFDGNPNTIGNPVWTPLITPVPNHPDYISAHSGVSSAGATVLAAYFGDNTSFTVDSYNPAHSGVIRSFSSFHEALEEIANARIWGGLHFRTACDAGLALGNAAANNVLQNGMLTGHGNGDFFDGEQE